MLAAVDLLSRGYEVFRSVSQACSCDLIAMKNRRLLRVEVRMAARNPSTGTLYWPPMDSKKADIGAVITDMGAVVYVDPGTRQEIII